MFNKLVGLFSKDLAMDLGTANTLLYTKKEGIIINEPSVVALDARTNAILAVGVQAKEFLGRTPKRVKAVRPMKDGVIADFEVTRDMIAYFIKKAMHGVRLIKPSMVICVPSGITQVEKRAVIDSATLAGAREILLIEEPMAAAIGANLPVHEPVGSLVLDIGGGTSEVALISLSAIAYSESIRVAGDAMNMAVQRYFKEVFRLAIGENTAENVKIIIGSAMPMPDAPTLDVSGKDLLTGIPKVVRVNEGHIREALKETTTAIINTILKVLENTPPELSADIYKNGLLLAGGGSLLKGLDQLIAKETKLKVVMDVDPLTTVLRGTGKTLDNKKLYSSVFIN